MSHVLDLSNRHFTREVRMGLTIIGTWLLTADDRWRPCLVIIRRGEETNDHTMPCVVTVDQAWIFDGRVGDAYRAAKMAILFCEALRLDTHDWRVVDRLGTLIHDHLGDLMHIPPYQPREQNAVGEITMTDSTGRTVEKEIIQDV